MHFVYLGVTFIYIYIYVCAGTTPIHVGVRLDAYVMLFGLFVSLQLNMVVFRSLSLCSLSITLIVC